MKHGQARETERDAERLKAKQSREKKDKRFKVMSSNADSDISLKT